MNALLGAAPVRRLLEKVLGISSKRTLPRFAAQPFTRWFAERAAAGSGGGPLAAAPRTAPPAQLNGGVPTAGSSTAARSVVLFNDTFNTYNDPEVAIAAVEVLEAAGYRVVLPGHWCCGRPMVSKGLVEQARAAARTTVDKLHPLVAQGMPVVGLEPSCILTLKDEYLSLLPGDAKARAVADAVWTFEEFVAAEAEAGRFAPQFRPEAGRVLLHGHCHQKALVGTGPSHRALELAGYTVDEVDSGCCGMAGSFGYEAEHLEVSLAMAERRLLPAVRAAGEATVIAAAGTSCRHQIAHGCTREALHPAQILRNALVADRDR